ncbi:MAG TPA: hypothetical protein DCS55_10585 [Acidimicrobiaceae bacterium]|nr:hypothetical protein [Acidimicrobiaceae bacterium]
MMRGVHHLSCRGRDDRGAALIELALVVPVMLVLAFGLIGLGLAYKSSSVLVSSSRSGARLAAAAYAPAVADNAQRAAMLENLRVSVERNLDGLPGQAEPRTLWVFRADSSGEPTGGPGCTSDCIRWTWDEATGTFGSQTGTWPAPRACGAVIDSVGVRLTARHQIDSPVFDGLDIERSTVMRLEPISDQAC